jgi:ring-1,2-phenylacetyl-CoA epoxidase subunit PaaD
VNGPTTATAARACPAAGESAAAGGSRPSAAEAWLALAAVPDPEIPVVSVAELGILRGVEWDAADPATLVVVLTPTYSGCPATEAIMRSIREALAAAGVARVRLDVRLSPAWSTDWITPEARRKLRDFGIAPPEGAGASAARNGTIDVSGISPLRRVVSAVPCPRCGSAQTRLLSQFGSTACKAQYRCLDCLEPFDYFKPH